MSGSGISWAICKSAPRSSQITMPVPHHSVFYRPDALPAAQPTASKHWRLYLAYILKVNLHRHARHDKTVLSVSRPLRRCQLDSRQLKSVADRKFEVGKHVQSNRPIHTRHDTDRTVLSCLLWRCELSRPDKCVQRRSVSGGAGTAGATAGRTPTQNALAFTLSSAEPVSVKVNNWSKNFDVRPHRAGCPLKMFTFLFGAAWPPLIDGSLGQP